MIQLNDCPFCHQPVKLEAHMWRNEFSMEIKHTRDFNLCPMHFYSFIPYRIQEGRMKGVVFPSYLIHRSMDRFLYMWDKAGVSE